VELLFILNLAVAVSLIVSPMWWSRRLLDVGWLNPVSLAVICMLPVDLFRLFVGQMFRGDGLLAPEYQFAVLMTNVQNGVALLMLLLAARLRVVRRLPQWLPEFGRFEPLDLRRFAKAFFLLYLAAFLILAIKTGGVADWLLNIRSSYIEKRDGNGTYYAAAVNFLSISYFFFGVSSPRSARFTLFTVLYIAAIYVLGSKGFVLQFFIFYLIIILRQRQVKIGRVLVVALPTAFVLLLVNFFSSLDAVQLASVAEYFDYYPNAAMYYADYFRGAIGLFDGQVFLSSFWEYAPRSIFPQKPYVYGILHIVEFYYPGGAESGNTPAFEGGVPQFADFGILGVVMFAVLNLKPLIYFAGLRYTLKEQAFLRYGAMSGRAIIAGVLLFAPSFGTFLPVGLIGVMMLFIIGYGQVVRMTSRSIAPPV
jgi:hypothetical protein